MRRTPIALALAALLLLAAGAAVLATRGPSVADRSTELADEHETGTEAEEAPSAEDLAHAADRLRASAAIQDAGLTIDDAVLADLAARYGVGGAVRLYAWSAETGDSVETLAAMRDGTDGHPVGWGRLAKDLGVKPGIGHIMGGGAGEEAGEE